MTIRRNRQGQNNQIEVFAEMTEQYTEDMANATMLFSVYDSEYRALAIKPIPNTFEGDADYKFFVSTILPHYNMPHFLYKFGYNTVMFWLPSL